MYDIALTNLFSTVYMNCVDVVEINKKMKLYFLWVLNIPRPRPIYYTKLYITHF